MRPVTCTPISLAKKNASLIFIIESSNCKKHFPDSGDDTILKWMLVCLRNSHNKTTFHNNLLHIL